MANQRSFGRRHRHHSVIVQRAPDGDIAKPGDEIIHAQLSQAALPSEVSEPPSLDDELREWKRSRKTGLKIPWRQVSLMASLCFGVASFVLPESVNSTVQLLLYALIAASLYAGVAKLGAAKS
jgi:hypothetical protein